MARTATIQKKICSFDELSPEIQKQVLEKYRNREVDPYDWHDPIIEGVKEELEAMGFKDVTVGFSGFWSQGDGASFTAKSIDIEVYLKHFKLGSQYRALLKPAKEGNISGHVVRDKFTHYMHENTISAYLNAEVEFDAYNANKLEELEVYIQAQVKSYSHEIYRRLERYYDELTSDASVKAYIEANIEEFEESGTPYVESHLEEAEEESSTNKVDISDDLKSNFRSWEVDHQTESDVTSLTSILVIRHPEADPVEVRKMAEHWCGVVE